MKSLRRFSLNLETLTVFTLFMVFAGTSRADEAGLKQFWQDFRQVNPFHVQTIVSSPEPAAGQRTLLITEPPPDFADPAAPSFSARLKTELSNIFGDALTGHEVFTHPIGYDGWIKDIGVTLRYPPGESQMFEADILRLHRRLFGTTYKATIQEFEKNAANKHLAHARKLGPPNLEVNAASLNDWLFQRQMKFVRIGQRPNIKGAAPGLNQGNLRELFETNSWGLFQSENNGLIIILVPRRTVKLNEFTAELRKFTVDTDSILGVVAWGDSQLAIVGRERDTSLTAIPPLRVESILTLAATKEDDLEQSYERNAVFAGKIGKGAKEWAPIYLSKDLTNTEVGSLLNITDQILKSWSEAGDYNYERFPYSVPSGFPERRGVFQALVGSGSGVTYNWNTTGLGYSIKNSRYEIFALERTGALPVSYIPEGTKEKDGDKQLAPVRRLEDAFWAFFSQYRDPNLNRAVQYTALYIAFRKYPVDASRTEPVASGYGARMDAIKNEVKRALLQIKNSNVNLADSVKKHICNSDVASAAKQTLSEDKLTEMRRQIQQGLLIDSKHTDRLAAALSDRHTLLPSSDRIAVVDKELNQAFRAQYIDEIVGRLNVLPASMRENVLNLFALYNARDYKNAVELLGDCTKVRNALIESNRSFDRAYIKTPSIVLSWDERPFLSLISTGGHNLYSKATKVLPDESVPKGKISISANGELRINPADVASSGKIAREYQRNLATLTPESASDKARLARRLESTLRDLPQTVEDITVALKRQPPPNTTGRGLTKELLSSDARMIGDAGVRPTISEIVALESRAAAQEADVVLAKAENGMFQVHCPGCKPPVAISTPSRVNAHAEAAHFAEIAAAQKTGRQGSVVVYSDANFSRGEIEAFRLSAETTQAAGGGAGGRGGGFRRTFFSAEEPGNAGGGTGPRKGLWYMGRERPQSPWSILSISSENPTNARRLLSRTDAKWSEARISEVRNQSVGQQATQVSHRVEIPFEQRPNAFIEFLSLFKRAPKPEQIDTISQIVQKGLVKNSIAESTLGDRLIEIRSQFIEKLGDDAQLQMKLQDATEDIFIVKKEPLPDAQS